MDSVPVDLVESTDCSFVSTGLTRIHLPGGNITLKEYPFQNGTIANAPAQREPMPKNQSF
jgi:hypothetical protein